MFWSHRSTLTDYSISLTLYSNAAMGSLEYFLIRNLSPSALRKAKDFNLRYARKRFSAQSANRAYVARRYLLQARVSFNRFVHPLTTVFRVEFNSDKIDGKPALKLRLMRIRYTLFQDIILYVNALFKFCESTTINHPFPRQ